MQTLGEIKALLAARGLRPRHRFGQNFLIEPVHLRTLVDRAELAPGDVVLEVGPGTGVLTEELLARDAEVVACEIDRDLAALLAERLGDRIRLLVGDALPSKRTLAPPVLEALAGRPFRLVANLPYAIASPLLAVLAGIEGFRGGCATVQREVADRLAAPPGIRAYGPLSVVVQSRFAVERIADLPPGCFWPPPEVSSAMVRLAPLDRPLVAAEDLDAFGRFVAEIFGRRRKQLGSILGRSRTLPTGIDPEMRPERLAPEQWIELERWRSAGAEPQAGA